MASKITQQQLDALNAIRGEPVSSVDEAYYLVDANSLRTSRKQLTALIQAGIDSIHIPADQAADELRRYADQLGSKHA